MTQHPHTIVQPVLVAACGNSLAGDDAFGPLVAERLRQESPACVDVLDLGMKPAGLIDQLADRLGLIIVDAAVCVDPQPSHDLIDRDVGNGRLPSLVHDVALSSHGLSLAHELALAEVLGMLPRRVHVIAAAALRTKMGDVASPHVLQLVEPAAQRVLQLAEAWLAERMDNETYTCDSSHTQERMEHSGGKRRASGGTP